MSAWLHLPNKEDKMPSKNEVKGQQDGTCERLAARRAANSSNGIKTRTLTPSPGDARQFLCSLITYAEDLLRNMIAISFEVS